MEQPNNTLLCDYYELTMGNGYFETGLKDRITYFDVFFRQVPDHGGFAIAAGLEQIIEYIKNLHFSEADIQFLREKRLFSEDFLKYLSAFRFSGDIWAVPEGTPIFPGEPILTVRAPAIEAQLIETFVLLSPKPPVLDCNKGEPDCPRGKRAGGAGIWLPARAGRGRRGPRRPGGLYSGMRRNRLHPDRPALRRAGRRHDGAFLDSDVR